MNYFEDQLSTYLGKSRLRCILEARGLETIDDLDATDEFTITKEFNVPTSYGMVKMEYNPVTEDVTFDNISIDRIANVAFDVLCRLGIAIYAMKGSVSKNSLYSMDGLPIKSADDAKTAIRARVKQMFQYSYGKSK